MSNIDSNIKLGKYQMGQNPLVETTWLQFHNTAHSSWIMKISNAVKLYNKLREINPKHILELGTGIGCSTSVMASACPEASIYTVDCNQKCLDVAKMMIPITFQERIYFMKVGVEVAMIPQVNPLQYWSTYTDYDWKHFDFILIDGPGPFLKDVHIKSKTYPTCAELPNADLIFLLPLMKEGTLIYVDGRKHAVSLYLRHLGHYIDVVEPLIEIEGQEIWDNSQGYILFKRNNKPLDRNLEDFDNSDMVFLVLNQGGYFDAKPKDKS